MDEPRPPHRRPVRPSGAAVRGRHHIESVAHHFLAEAEVPGAGPQEAPAHLLVATRSAARATAAWTARLVRALVGTDGMVATDDRLASCCEVSERRGLQWSVGSYFPGVAARSQEHGEPGAEMAPAVTGPARVWRIEGDVPVEPEEGDHPVHHLGRIDSAYLDWCENTLPESEPRRRHVLWCISREQTESWAEAHLLGRLLLASDAERLTLVQLPPGWPVGAAPWRQRVRRWAGRATEGPAAERLADLAGAVAPHVRIARWSWQEGRAAGSSRRWRVLLAGD